MWRISKTALNQAVVLLKRLHLDDGIGGHKVGSDEGRG